VGAPPLFRSIRARYIDIAIVISTRHADPPRITADLAVLNETAMDVRLDVDLHLLAAKRTRDHEFVWHCRLSYSYWAADAARHHT